MKRVLLAGVSLAAALGLTNGAHAADSGKSACRTVVDPYKNYACLEPYLGTEFISRLINYYKLEWGHAGAPADP